MRTITLPFIGLTVLLLTSAPASADTRQVVLDNTGRVVVPLTDGRGDVNVIVRGILANQSLACRPLSSFDNTAEPSAADAEPPSTSSSTGDRTFRLRDWSAPFALCSLRQANRVPLKEGEKAAMMAEQEAVLQKRIEQLTTVVTASTQASALLVAEKGLLAAAAAEDALTLENQERLRVFREPRAERIKALGADAEAYKNPDPEAAVTELKRLQELIRSLQQEIDAEKARLDAQLVPVANRRTQATAARDAAQGAVDGLKESVEIRELRTARNDSISRRQLAENDSYSVLSVFHVFVHSDDKAVFYRVLSTTPRVGQTTVIAALERAAPFPTLTTESRPYAVVVNYRRADAPYPFVLSFATEDGVAPDLAPVRPTTQAKVQGADAARFNTANAWRDFVMPFGEGFKAHTVIKATISSVTNSVAEDSFKETRSDPKKDADGTARVVRTEVKNVELIKAERYPQIRALYRFNFTTGVVFSGLQEQTPIRVKTELDDPATTPANEARYKDGIVEGSGSVIPMFAVTVYPRALDIAKPMSWRDRLLPSPTFGFAFQNPQDNAFVGMSIEPFRGLQVLGGVHFGKVSKERAVESTDKEDPASSSPKLTDKHFDQSWFLGLSFNVNFVKAMFGS